MGCEEFLNMMEQEEVVNPNLSRELINFRNKVKTYRLE
jgi:hypothetical protein